MRRLRRSLAVLALATLVAGTFSACGFHLRGAEELPGALERTYLQGVSHDSELAAEVRAALESAGGEVVVRLADATAILQLGRERTERRVASVDSGGKAREYSVRYTLPFTVLNPAGDALLPRRTVETSRTYNFDSVNVLGSGSEEAVLVREMRGFAVRQMLRQVRMAADEGFPAAAPADADSADEAP